MNENTLAFEGAPVWPYLAFNSEGERLEVCPDLVLNLEYWDCECQHDYIHTLDKTACAKCGLAQEDGPSSRENEVRKWVKGAHPQPDYREHNARQTSSPKPGGV